MSPDVALTGAKKGLRLKVDAGEWDLFSARLNTIHSSMRHFVQSAAGIRRTNAYRLTRHSGKLSPVQTTRDTNVEYASPYPPESQRCCAPRPPHRASAMYRRRG
ncbi:hypothetical protein BCAR13_80125 [Paraburkholderia caribensis]|nr:hypothetical protein BCAR13_80125 [Paraburkholderia caribensis]